VRAKYFVIVAAAIAVALLAVRFGKTLPQPLSYNDTGESVYLVAEVLPQHHGWRDLWRWSHSHWPMQRASYYYRPLAMASFVLDWHLWRLNPFGYRLTNLLLLIACGLALGALAARFAGPGGWLAAVIFAAAPHRLDAYYLITPASYLFLIQTKATVWVIARPDLLAALFCLLAFHCATARGKAVWLAGPLYLLALLSKESAMPFAALATVYAFLDQSPWRLKWRYLLLLWAALALYLLLRQHALGTDPLSQVAGLPKKPYTVFRWLGLLMLGPAIRLTGLLSQVATCGWVLFTPHTYVWLFEGAVYLVSLFLLLRYRTRQYCLWMAWALLFVMPIFWLPVFWAWGHYWFLPSLPAPVLMSLVVVTFWERVVAPTRFGQRVAAALARKP